MSQRRSFSFIMLPLIIFCLSQVELFSAARIAAPTDVPHERTFLARLSESSGTFHYFSLDTKAGPRAVFGTLTATSPKEHTYIITTFPNERSLDDALTHKDLPFSTAIEIIINPDSDQALIRYYRAGSLTAEYFMKLPCFRENLAKITHNDTSISIEALLKGCLPDKTCSLQQRYKKLIAMLFPETSALSGSADTASGAAGGCGARRQAQRLTSAETVGYGDDAPSSPAERGGGRPVSAGLVSPR